MIDDDINKISIRTISKSVFINLLTSIKTAATYCVDNNSAQENKSIFNRKKKLTISTNDKKAKI